MRLCHIFLSNDAGMQLVGSEAVYLLTDVLFDRYLLYTFYYYTTLFNDALCSTVEARV